MAVRKRNKKKKIIQYSVLSGCLGFGLGFLIHMGISWLQNTVSDAAGVMTETTNAALDEEFDNAAAGDRTDGTSDPGSGSQTEKKTYPLLVRSSYDGLDYCMYIPSEIDPEEEYPMMLYYHGAGERGDGNIAQIGDAGVAPYITDFDFYNEHPCIILAPQCPADEWWTDALYEESRDNYSVDDYHENAYMTASLELLKYVKTQYPVDTDRIYISGVSMGGFACWELLERYPDTFAAAVILCGGGDPDKAEEMKNIPIRFFHGAKDDEVPVEDSREMAEKFEEVGAKDVVYKEYEDIGHWIWLCAWEEDGLLDWIFEQSRQNRTDGIDGTDGTETEVSDPQT